MKKVADILTAMLLFVAVACSPDGDVARIERHLSRDLRSLDGYVFASLNSEDGSLPTSDIPSSMTIYRYERDSLVWWVGELPISGDDTFLPKDDALAVRGAHPLTVVGDEYTLVEAASRKYIAYRSDFEGDIAIFAAFRLPDALSINVRSLSDSTGTVVSLTSRREQGVSVPVFRFDPQELPGTNSQVAQQLLSPKYYAGRVFPNLFYLLLSNLLMAIVALAVARLNERWKALPKGTVVAAVMFVVLLIYGHVTLMSMIKNSCGLFASLSIGLVFVLLSYIVIAYSMLLFLQQVVRSHRRGVVTVFAALMALYLMTMVVVLNSKKEKAKVDVWAELLCQDRDLRFERLLKKLELNVLSDAKIKECMESDNASLVQLIPFYVRAHYLDFIPTDYDVTIWCTDGGPRDNDHIRKFLAADRKSYLPLSQHGTTYFIPDNSGYTKYVSFYSYYNHAQKKYNHILLSFVQNPVADQSGYRTLMTDYQPTNVVSMPERYSYARYIGGRLVDYSGYFSYPAVVNEEWLLRVHGDNDTFQAGKYLHYKVNPLPDEIIFISRSKMSVLSIVLMYAYIFVILLVCFILLGRRDRQQTFSTGRFKARIRRLVVLSLVGALVGMAAVSTTFVSRRNVAMQNRLMSDRILSAQILFESRLQDHTFESLLADVDFTEYFASIAKTTKTDFSLFSPDGRVFLCTMPIIYERGVLPSRISAQAFEKITREHRRSYIQKTTVGGRQCHLLYAPIMNSKGEIVAILSSPYLDEDNTFLKDAATHAALMLGMVFLLLSTAVLVSERILSSLFGPLTSMGREMTNATYKEIVYNGNDEVADIVHAYNKMVREVYESQRILAQSERDKAWSEMARQVAHEIKNPLTPIKLEIQRLIRLKERGVQDWDERFERSCAVVLEHIDILADTANEFSTFARLYTQENTRFDVDATLSEQVSLFGAKEGVRVSYLGTRDCVISAPKPQIIRVFTNLISNAVQAVEGQEDGRVLVSLRNADRSGWIDILVEDNGPGVSPENLDKLFTPNFTTKSSGTGLGLAICHNIVEKCGGEIIYSRSFNLHGACFTIKLPKNE